MNFILSTSVYAFLNSIALILTGDIDVLLKFLYRTTANNEQKEMEKKLARSQKHTAMTMLVREGNTAKTL
jgi:hypothetical protein